MSALLTALRESGSKAECLSWLARKIEQHDALHQECEALRILLDRVQARSAEVEAAYHGAIRENQDLRAQLQPATIAERRAS